MKGTNAKNLPKVAAHEGNQQIREQNSGAPQNQPNVVHTSRERGGDYDVEVKGVKISPDPAVRGKPVTFSISESTGEMSFRKMDDKKHPREFVPEADLQGIQPLPSDFDKWKRYKVEDDRRGYSSERGRLSIGMV